MVKSAPQNPPRPASDSCAASQPNLLPVPLPQPGPGRTDSPALEARLQAARARKLTRRRVRGQDFQQVTVILDTELSKNLDQCLARMGETPQGRVRISRSMLVRALLRRFLDRRSDQMPSLRLDGLFTPDPRSPEEQEMVEAALVERLRETSADLAASPVKGRADRGPRP